MGETANGISGVAGAEAGPGRGAAGRLSEGLRVNGPQKVREQN